MLGSPPGRKATARGLLGVAAAAALLVGCSSPGKGTENTASVSSASSASSSATSSAHHKPNIIYVLTDDLSWNLVRYMPHVQQMQHQGTTFSDYYVTDSLCCPSRSSIFTGEYPHNTGVFTNNGDDGGYGAFMKNGDEKKCYAPALQKAGYRTGFMGKYLNGYEPKDTQGADHPYVPPGWNEWDTAGNGYPEFNYDLNENGKVVHYGHDPKDYLTDVVSGKARSFVDSSAQDGKPFMLEVATFAPHAPSTPAPRDAHSFPDLKAPRTPAYDKPSVPTPQWQKALSPLTQKEKTQIDTAFAKRVRSVQAVDAMIGRIQDELKAKGLADDTYLMFGSDNGFHMGEHRLRPGKQTAYDTDVRVPMMVTGPGVPAGKTVSQLVQNTDLNPTFQALAGLPAPSTADGLSLADLMHGRSPDHWRQSVLIEHHHPETKAGDPDAAPKAAGNPPTYEAIRTADSLWVEYADGEREYYDTHADPNELKNKAGTLSDARKKSLHATLSALAHCHGSANCESASALHG
ncbi:sulfatase [Streptomyces sp. NPDC046985]|uniref:sulfatase family protein n=1 Tax=Streptomyces sp. NPDC046985 TaxID=3155377 RepID=UPI0033D0339F